MAVVGKHYMAAQGNGTKYVSAQTFLCFAHAGPIEFAQLQIAAGLHAKPNPNAIAEQDIQNELCIVAARVSTPSMCVWLTSRWHT
jgi:hypothetical protein